MYKTEFFEKQFKSARSGRATKIVLAPTFLVYAFFAIGVLLQVPASYIIDKFSFTLGMLFSQVVTLLLPVLVAIRFFGLTGARVVPFKKVTVRAMVTAAVIMLSLAVISEYLIFLTEWLLPIPYSLAEAYQKLMSVDGIGSVFLKFSFLCIIPAFCEELFFRGFCQTSLVRHYGRKLGIVIVAAMFAAAHLNPWYAHLYFLLGIILGWLFATSGSLWIPIICHFVNNLWTFTTYVSGYHLPIDYCRSWKNIPIVVVAIFILVFSIRLWSKSVKKEKE